MIRRISRALAQPAQWAAVAIWLFVLLSPVPGVFFDWASYREQLRLPRRPGAVLWPMFVVLYLHTALILLAPALIGALLLRLRLPRLAAWSAVMGFTLVYLSLALDRITIHLNGTHPLQYLEIVWNDLPLWWKTYPRTIVNGALMAAQLMWGVAAGWWLCAFTARRLNARFTARGSLRRLAVVSATLLLATPITQLWCNEPSALYRLHQLLPIPMKWTSVGYPFPQPAQFDRAFAKAMDPAALEQITVLHQAPPLDTQARVPAPPSGADPLPDVLMIVVESLRAEALRGAVMPRLTDWSSRGLTLPLHYAGANVTHAGMFNLLYARPSFLFDQTLDAKLQPQMCVTFRNSGYHCLFMSGWSMPWMRFDEFTGVPAFDEEFTSPATTPWPQGDRQMLAEVRRRLRPRVGAARDAPSRKPQFLFLCLNSPHLPYEYPPEYERRKGMLVGWDIFSANPHRFREPLTNRYYNALGFIDDLVGQLLEEIDLDRTLVLITGDHGESIWDDGSLSHNSKLSDVETRVPCLLIGAGVKPGTTAGPTSHPDLLPTILHAIAGRSVPVGHIAGRDALAPDFHPMAVPLSATAAAGGGRFIMTARNARAVFQIHSSAINVIGSSSPAGEFLLDAPGPPAQAKAWAREISGLINRLASSGPSSPVPN